MVRPIKVIVGAAFYITVSFSLAAANDAPFGIAMGMPKKDLKIVREIETNRFLLETVPQPHDLLKSYSVLADDKNGVCSITGYLPLTDKHQVDIAVATFVHQLEEKYGRHEIIHATADPNEIEVYFWVPRTSIKRISVHVFQGSVSTKRAAMVDILFQNEQKCLVKDGRNPF